MGLENYNHINEEEALADKIKNSIDESKRQENQAASEFIKLLDENNLTTLIEKELKDTETQSWLTHGEMRSNPFYGFMVQASIDLLSNKLVKEVNGIKRFIKFDEKGDESDHGKTLDQWLSQRGGIDNKYKEGTKGLVKMVQNILGINIDGYAGPQFFANMTAFLKDSNLDGFKVKGIDDYTYSNITDKLAQKEKKIDNLKDLPLDNNSFKFDIYVYTKGSVEYIFYKNGGVEKKYKDRESANWITTSLDSKQISSELGIDYKIIVEKNNTNNLQNNYDKLKEKYGFKQDNISYVGTITTDTTISLRGTDENNKFLVEKKTINEGSTFIISAKDNLAYYVDPDGEVIGYAVLITPTVLSAGEKTKATINTLYDYDHTLFKNLATEYNKIWAVKDGEYIKSKKDQAILNGWRGLNSLTNKYNGRDVVEFATNSILGKEFIKRGEDERKKDADANTTLKNFLFYKLAIGETLN